MLNQFLLSCLASQFGVSFMKDFRSYTFEELVEWAVLHKKWREAPAGKYQSALRTAHQRHGLKILKYEWEYGVTETI